MTPEEFRSAVGFDGYAVSNTGRVRSYKVHSGGRDMKLHISRWGYPSLSLHIDGRRRPVHVHVLVARAFLGPRPDGYVVRHLDGNPRNNRVDNLAYGSTLENVHDTLRHGRHRGASKTTCSKGHPYDAVNTYTHPVSLKRTCRTCNRGNVRRYAAKKRAQAAATNDARSAS